MASRAFVFAFISVLCQMFLKGAFSAENGVTITAPHQEYRHNKWVSRVISDHIWDYKIISEANPNCTQHFEIYQQHLKNFTTWAVQMFDSSDLVPGGFVVGDAYKLGNFEECVHVKIPRDLEFSAQYCLPSFKFNRIHFEKTEYHEEPNDWKWTVWNRLETSNQRTKVPKDIFNLAFCLPSTCSPDDIQSSLQAFLEGPMKHERYEINVTLTNLQCTTTHDSPMSVGTLIMRYFIIGITSVLLFCSAADIILAVLRPEKHDITNFSFAEASGVERWLLPFSLFRNVRQLLAPTSSPDDYKILHGIKAVLMVLVVSAHRGILGCDKTPLINWTYFENRIHEHSIYYVGMPIPDIFFCVSGFLMCVSMTKQFEKNTFNIWAHVANKIIRVLPPYMFVLAGTIFVLPNLGNGPLWKTIIESDVDYCRRNWWKNLLFINNYSQSGDWCLPHTYYIAADVHFFIVGSILVYLCCRWKPYSVVILGSACLLSFLMPFLSVTRNQYEGLIKIYPDFLAKPRSHGMIINMYFKSHARFGGYITGIVSAFLLKHLQKRGGKLSKIASWTGVLVGVFMVIGISTIRHVLHSPSTPYSVIPHALYAALNTQILCSGVMIIVIVQITTGFGVLNPIFLAHDIFVPFSRLSYWTYLLNVPVIMFFIGSSKTPMYMTYEDMAFAGQYMGDVFMYCVAIYCYMIIEAPINHVKPTILKYISSIRSSPNKKDL